MALIDCGGSKLQACEHVLQRQLLVMRNYFGSAEALGQEAKNRRDGYARSADAGSPAHYPVIDRNSANLHSFIIGGWGISWHVGVSGLSQS